MAGAALLTVALWPHSKVKNSEIAASAPQRIAINTGPSTLEVSPIVHAAPPNLTPLAPKATSSKPTVKTPPIASPAAAKKMEQVADANVTPTKPVALRNAAPPKQRLASGHSPTVKTPQTPSPVEPRELAVAAYLPKPNMDRNNQRPPLAANVPDKDAPLPDERSAETPTLSKPIVIASADAAPKKERWEGHYIEPPANSRQMTPSFMRQQRQAHNAGYGELAISSIKQNQIQLRTEIRF